MMVGLGRRKWVIMVMLTVLHIVGILIFIRGFLLLRTELPYYSNSSDVSRSPWFDHTQSNPTCWTRPADRLVIIVLDALRFDSVAPSSFFKESKPWTDRLPVLQKLESTEGTSARIFKAIADPPTTSLQRLKGFTTGGLPTFIDVGNSFGAPAIVEDNFIHQVRCSSFTFIPFVGFKWKAGSDDGGWYLGSVVS
ncbi:hypothetical protein Patl1_05661 [Pistacia atlantica]|uniref:Uncharacterized protein n=1 Tax=Pistacia atlantica TaxID=434234 RepID=A0ACC1BPC1_9ROSI|nr:hypothetical protein Patl1_05661 [Pistacia atlantica]